MQQLRGRKTKTARNNPADGLQNLKRKPTSSQSGKLSVAVINCSNRWIEIRVDETGTEANE